MKKELLILKRKKAKELHDKGWSNRRIAGHLFACKDSVGKWVQMDENEILTDNRGWKKGRTRVYTPETKQQIIKIRKDLEKENSYFFGSKVVKENYEHQTEERVSKSFVDCVLKEAGLVKSQRKKKKGRSKYMKYPEYTLIKLGKSMMSIDFIGPKYLKGSDNRINFLSCKYIRPEKLGLVKRIEGQTAKQTIKTLKEIWQMHPIPEILKIDNDSAFGANLPHEKYMGQLTFFLLNLGVSPLYIAQRSPWNNGQVEGFNSVFSKKFWNTLQFNDEQEIDVKIVDFNVAYEKYSQLVSNNPEINKKDIKYMVDFKDVNLETINSSPMVCSPLNLFDCCPIPDGAAAIVLSMIKKSDQDAFRTNTEKHDLSMPLDATYNAQDPIRRNKAIHFGGIITLDIKSAIMLLDY